MKSGIELLPGPGIPGELGTVNTLSIGTVTTGAPGSAAAASITGQAPIQTLNLTIPQGTTGPVNTLSIGAVTTGAPGSAAAASITGQAPIQTLNLTIPQGTTGPVNTLSIGTVTTGAPGSAAAASITGQAPAQTLNLTIPQGVAGTGSNDTILTIGSVSTSSLTPVNIPGLSFAATAGVYYLINIDLIITPTAFGNTIIQWSTASDRMIGGLVATFFNGSSGVGMEGMIGNFGGSEIYLPVAGWEEKQFLNLRGIICFIDGGSVTMKISTAVNNHAVYVHKGLARFSAL